MNIPPAPGWLYNYFQIPMDKYMTAIQVASHLGVSKVTAYRYLYDFLKLNLVERKRVNGQGGRKSWGYRRVLCRIIYNEDLVARYMGD
jgi:predicted transcriptional regulator